MERLTYWNKSNENYAINSTRENGVTAYKAVQKLGKLEDLEEQLGISLLDLHSMIGKTIYCAIEPYTMDYEINYLKSLIDEDDEISIYEIMYITNHSAIHQHYDITEFELKYFGIYWFLTQEEAEKKLEELKNEN